LKPVGMAGGLGKDLMLLLSSGHCLRGVGQGGWLGCGAGGGLSPRGLIQFKDVLWQERLEKKKQWIGEILSKEQSS
jgi:hypothetical protein